MNKLLKFPNIKKDTCHSAVTNDRINFLYWGALIFGVIIGLPFAIIYFLYRFFKYLIINLSKK